MVLKEWRNHSPASHPKQKMYERTSHELKKCLVIDQFAQYLGSTMWQTLCWLWWLYPPTKWPVSASRSLELNRDDELCPPVHVMSITKEKGQVLQSHLMGQAYLVKAPGI